MSVPTKVIIIDDDKPSVTVLTNELKAYQDVNVIATAFNSHDGEQAILKHKPQLIFLDIELPWESMAWSFWQHYVLKLIGK